jgi:hypothetical protein
MTDAQRVERVIRLWADIGDIPNTDLSLCDVWRLGPNAASAPCNEALEDLIEALDKEFSTRFALTLGDFDGQIDSVEALIAFVLLHPVTQAFSQAMLAAAVSDPNALNATAARSLEAAMTTLRKLRRPEAKTRKSTRRKA